MCVSATRCSARTPLRQFLDQFTVEKESGVLRAGRGVHGAEAEPQQGTQLLDGGFGRIDHGFEPLIDSLHLVLEEGKHQVRLAGKQPVEAAGRGVGGGQHLTDLQGAEV
ncbi:hypothetical protein [Streptomyces sp. KL116D]|uniref:hypothetical protein n=1 Tax=Streptomyces sp. KL116D TaxID=3045152 RepID=UPI003556BF34